MEGSGKTYPRGLNSASCSFLIATALRRPQPKQRSFQHRIVKPEPFLSQNVLEDQIRLRREAKELTSWSKPVQPRF